jgi:hypothetical protein
MMDESLRSTMYVKEAKKERFVSFVGNSPRVLRGAIGCHIVDAESCIILHAVAL